MSTLGPQVQAAHVRGDHKTDKPLASKAQALLRLIERNEAEGYGSVDQSRRSSSRGAPTNKNFQWAVKPTYAQEDSTIKKEKVNSESKVREIELRTTALEAQMVEVMSFLKKNKVKSDSGKIEQLYQELRSAENVMRSMTVRFEQARQEAEQARQQAEQAHQTCIALTEENTRLKMVCEIQGVSGVPSGAGADLNASVSADEQEKYMNELRHVQIAHEPDAVGATAAPTTASDPAALAAMEAVEAVGSSSSAQLHATAKYSAPTASGPLKPAPPSPGTSPVRSQPVPAAAPPHRTQQTGLGHQAGAPQPQPHQPSGNAGGAASN